MDVLQKLCEYIKNSQFTRILLVVFLVLVLQIPTAMIQGLVYERQSLRQEAIGDITTKWGQQQSIIGPRLAVPYIKRIQVGDKVRAETKYGVFLPTKLNIEGQLQTQVRNRGIYDVPVYEAKLNLDGTFERPDLISWGVRPEDILWNQAELSLQVADAHAIQNQATLTWNAKAIDFDPGIGKFGGGGTGIHANLSQQMTGTGFAFKIPLIVKGSEKFTLAPFGQVTRVKLTSNWTNPSFQGLWLPDPRTVSTSGFNASWDIPSLGRNYPQQWNTESPVSADVINGSVFGVDFLTPVDNYRMAERSLKYNFLFLVLTFATFWLFEVTTKLRVHPLQYLLVGVAMSLFYLLQLALSEHLGFQPAYWVATGAVIIMITSYSIAVLRAKKRGGIMGAVQAALYGYLYIVLVNQDYALLIGSIGLFAFLAIVMYLTHQINWFTPTPSTESETEGNR
jgi:inner membrane protein